MIKKISLVISISLITCMLLLPGCDEYNITEPRYYGNDDVLETLNECPDSTTYPGMLPWHYSLHICWFNKSEKILKIELALPEALGYQINVINSGGEILYTISGPRAAGYDWLYWDGGDYIDGVYGVTVSANEYKTAIWFEMK